MRLRQLEIFYHVYRCGSITAAANELNVSQPSVSKVLRHAEDQLGFLLFERNKGRLIATDAAHELYREARDIYDRIGALNRTATNIRNRKGGHLHIGTLPSLGLSLVPSAVAAVRQKRNALSFEVSTMHSNELLSALVERACDLCIGIHQEEHDLVEQRIIGRCELVVVAPPGRFDADPDSLDYRLLHEVDMVGLKNSGPAGSLLSEKLAAHEVVPHEFVTAHAYNAALPIVAEGLGVAVVDQFTASSRMAEGLEIFHLSDRPSLPLVASYRRGTQKLKLIDMIAEAISKRAVG